MLTQNSEMKSPNVLFCGGN